MNLTKVFASTVIDAPTEYLWKTLHNFNNVAKWHPAVTESAIEDEGTGDRVGAVRAISQTDGSRVREQLLALSDAEHFYTYSVIEAPYPFRDHRSTVRLYPVTTSNQTFVTWEAEFVILSGDADTMAQGVLQGVILLGFEGLRKLA